MSLQLLIRKYIDVHQGKHFVLEMLLNDVMQAVSDTYKIDREDLLRTCNDCLQNKIQPRHLCEGFVASKNNVRCTCPAVDNQRFCKRHLTQSTNEKNKTKRCVAINMNGSQCIRNAKCNNTLCGLHINKQKNDVIRDSDRRYPCGYYDETYEGEHVFCHKLALSDKWFCKKHQHLQTIYAPTYKSNCHEQYLEHIRSTGIRIEILEELLSEFT